MSLPELKDCYLDHVAIAVKNLSVAKKVYQDLGLVFSDHEEIVPDQKVKTAFAAIDTRAHIELLEPTEESSTIAKFIQNKGEGIHHLCFRVKDVKAKQKEMEAKGYQFIYPAPRPGAGGCMVNFIHPKSCYGVMIELSEKNHP